MKHLRLFLTCKLTSENVTGSQTPESKENNSLLPLFLVRGRVSEFLSVFHAWACSGQSEEGQEYGEFIQEEPQAQGTLTFYNGHVFPLLQRETLSLFSKAVHYINIFENSVVQRQWMPLLCSQDCSELWRMSSNSLSTE